MTMTSCILCGNPGPRTLYRIADMEILRCPDCGLGFQSELMPPAGLYGSAYFTSNDPLACGYGDYMGDRDNIARTFRRRFREILKFRKKGIILDIGCAAGFFLSVAGECGWEAKGIENSEFAASFAKENFSFEIFPSFEEARFQPGSFDAITMWDYLEHVSDPLMQLRNCHAVLKNDGFLFMTMPDVESLFSRLFKSKWIGIKKEHLFYFSSKTIKGLLDKAGFRMLSARHTGKYMRLGMLLERVKHYSPFLAGAAGRLLSPQARNSSMYINGLDILQIIAQKK